jgi:hypothetical protein
MSRIVFMIIMLIFVLSCDISKEDFVMPSANEENQTNTFYTTTLVGLSINPTAFQNLQKAKSLKISQLPVNGEAKFIENGFVFYKPTSLIAANDAFKIQGETANGVSVEEEIKINILKNSQDLPCYSGLIGENISVETESVTEIDVLANDKTCGKMGNLSIEIRPKNGKVEIVNQKLVYTPHQNYYGNDIFFYRVEINNSKNPVAPVEILIREAENCSKGMADDNIFIQNYQAGTDLLMDVLENDKICKEYENAELRIIKNPEKGTLRIDKNTLNRPIIFYRSQQKMPIDDSFEYALYRNEQNFIKAKVTIKIN